jgi:hypothetical protein
MSPFHFYHNPDITAGNNNFIDNSIYINFFDLKDIHLDGGKNRFIDNATTPLFIYGEMYKRSNFFTNPLPALAQNADDNSWLTTPTLSSTNLGALNGIIYDIQYGYSTLSGVVTLSGTNTTLGYLCRFYKHGWYQDNNNPTASPVSIYDNLFYSGLPFIAIPSGTYTNQDFKVVAFDLQAALINPLTGFVNLPVVTSISHLLQSTVSLQSDAAIQIREACYQAYKTAIIKAVSEGQLNASNGTTYLQDYNITNGLLYTASFSPDYWEKATFIYDEATINDLLGNTSHAINLLSGIGSVSGLTPAQIQIGNALKCQIENKDALIHEYISIPEYMVSKSTCNQAYELVTTQGTLGAQPLQARISDGTMMQKAVNSEESINAKAPSVYPNPFNTELNIEYYAKLGSQVSVRLTTPLGAEVLNSGVIVKNNGLGTLTINTETLSKGLYICSIVLDDHTYTYKVVLTR